MRNGATNLFSESAGSEFDFDGPTRTGAGGSGRLICLFVAFAVPLLAVAARLAQLQCWLADDYVAAFATTTESLESIPSIDGRVYAAEGRVLAEDVERYNISVHYRWLEDPPNEHWLTQQAVSKLSRSARRKHSFVDAERKKILIAREALWRRLAQVSGLSPRELSQKRATIQNRVEQLEAQLAERRQLRENEVSTDSSAAVTGRSLSERLWQRMVAALTTPPRREEQEPLIPREALDYHAIVEDVPLDVRAQIEAHPRWFPGVRVGSLSRRVYADSSFAPHVVGVRVPVTATDVIASESSIGLDPLDYRLGDRIGRSGIEAAYDSHLHGLRGLRRLTRNRYGEIVREETIRAPRSGGNVELTLNTAVERKMERLLDDALHPAAPAPAASVSVPTGGAIVALDVQSGALLVAASAPRFDLGSTGVPDSQTWQRLSHDPLRPLFHRAIQATLPPGSVFKVLSAVAILESGKIDPDERFECRGYLDQPNRFRCAIYLEQKVGHGPLDLCDALSRSCNVYFFHAADRLGPDPIVTWAQRFGIGRPTGIDLPYEKTGHLPDPEAVNRPLTSGQRVVQKWHRGETRTLAIGQSSLTVTPLQIARMMAAVANGGYLVTPFVARKSGLQLADDEMAAGSSRRVPIPGLSERTLTRLRTALTKVVSDPSGTGFHTVHTKAISIAGKTGTAQAGNGQADHAWFAGYASADNPRIAFAVVLEHAGPGAKAAGPLARQLVEALLADGILEPERLTLRQ